MGLDLGLVRPKHEAEPGFGSEMSPGDSELARRDDIASFRQISPVGEKLSGVFSLGLARRQVATVIDKK
ncbi:hypothetical protein A2U01_0073495 [Trifolium medium]|uniref:Uncharacterized protein n=1 Tax=Trifolium medium TaxID=97028 RepID=A0A392STS6_9FABA|nr:hypothetical protein [Trifolium medium]